MSKTNPALLIELLSQNEDLIGQLYQVYAELFTARQQFWQALANEERMHASWLRQIGELPNVKTSNRFSHAAVSTYRAYLQKEIELARSGAVDARRALVTSLYLEQSLIERRFFEAFTGEGQQFQDIVHQIVLETQEHISTIKAQLD